MRIGIDARPLLHPKTGIGRYTSELVIRLAADPTVEVYLYSNAPLDRFFANAPAVETNCQVRHGNLSGKFLSTLFAQCVFPFWSRFDKLDLFWSPRHHLPLLGKIPMAVTIHDMVWEKAPDTMAVGARLLESLLMPSALRRSTIVLAVSESTRTDLIEYDSKLSTKVHVTRLAPSFQWQHPPRLPTKGSYFLFVGTLEPRKNLHRLLVAYGKYREAENEAMPLIIAGNFGWKIDLEKHINDLGLTTSVTFHQNPSDHTLADLYSACFCLVMPSLYEGFGLPLVEAQSFGKPAITSNLASMPEVAGNAGVLVDPYSICAIAEAMSSMVKNEQIFNSMVNSAIEQTTRWNWDMAAKLTLELLTRKGSKSTLL